MDGELLGYGSLCSTQHGGGRLTAQLPEVLDALSRRRVLLEQNQVHGVEVRSPLHVNLLALLVDGVILVICIGASRRRLCKVAQADDTDDEGVDEEDEE